MIDMHAAGRRSAAAQADQRHADEFCEVFFTNVRVPADNLVGEMNTGWRIAQTTLGYERGGNTLGRVVAAAAVVRAAARGRQRAARRRHQAPSTIRSSARSWGRSAPRSKCCATRRCASLSRLEKGSRPARNPPSPSSTIPSWTSGSGADPGDPRPLRPAHRRACRRSYRVRHATVRRARELGHICFLLSRRRDDLRRIIGDPEEHHRRARPRAAERGARRPDCQRRACLAKLALRDGELMAIDRPAPAVDWASMAGMDVASHPLYPLFYARSVAVVGASPKGGYGLRVLSALTSSGFSGSIYPVNPNYDTIADLKAYPEIGAHSRAGRRRRHRGPRRGPCPGWCGRRSRRGARAASRSAAALPRRARTAGRCRPSCARSAASASR